jgi:hypothetical protein
MSPQHFQPSSPLFKPHERKGIIASNIGLTAMSSILYLWTKQVGLGFFAKLYFVPYLVFQPLIPFTRVDLDGILAAREPLDRYVDLSSSF